MTVEYPRIVWVVRHCEREDNINHRWRKDPRYSHFGHDNSPLSSRGKQQAAELARRFQNVQIDYCFASPFDRTIETAQAIVKEKPVKIFAEPGFCEALYLCEKPPSFWEPAQLAEAYPSVDVDYLPAFTKNTLPKEGLGDDACLPRVSRALDHLLPRHRGDVMIVSHGAAIGAIHAAFGHDFTYVGQATVSKFIETKRGDFEMEFSSDAGHLSDTRNLRAY